MTEFNLSEIEGKIYEIRGQRVMFDFDLAALYGVETRRLNEQVKRNLDRFPSDFMFILDDDEFEIFKKKIDPTGEIWGNRRYLPLVFTECGVAMLSSVLNSPRAISVNITIMRTFVRLRSFLAMDSNLEKRVENFQEGTNRMFKIVFQRLDILEKSINKKT